MAKIAVIGIGIYLFCQSAAFWGELLYSKNKIQFCLEQSIDGREAAELLKRETEAASSLGIKASFETECELLYLGREKTGRSGK